MTVRAGPDDHFSKMHARERLRSLFEVANHALTLSGKHETALYSV